MNIKTKQFGQALYELAEESNEVNNYFDLSLAIIDVANQSPEIFSYLSNNSISIEDKYPLINDITNGIKFYSNWLFILIESGRGRFIREYINEFIKIYNKKHNIENGYVWTIEPINREVINKFEELISTKLNKKIMLENKINKEIIGGVRLEVGDLVWDNTIKNKLIELIKRGSELNE